MWRIFGSEKLEPSKFSAMTPLANSYTKRRQLDAVPLNRRGTVGTTATNYVRPSKWNLLRLLPSRHPCRLSRVLELGDACLALADTHLMSDHSLDEGSREIMDICRRGFLRYASTSFVASSSATRRLCRACSPRHADEPDGGALFDVKSFGAVADGKTIDTAAVNIGLSRRLRRQAAALCVFRRGAYACHLIHLKNHVVLHLELGAIVLAAPSGGFDAAESNAPFESYQDFWP